MPKSKSTFPKTNEKVIRIKPQEGPQERCLASAADIAIFGGSAGSGKTYVLLMEPLRHLNNSKFGVVTFRRNTTQIRNMGGLWDESRKLYSLVGGAEFRESTLDIKFSSGMTVKYAHLEHEDTIYNWQGSQIPLIQFDELTHFSENQFFYMLSRNRSTSGVPGYIRATCNPDADSWVRQLIDWWIGPDGFAIRERSGVLRWFVRLDEQLIWANSKEELLNQYGQDCAPKSLTFIPSAIYDNKILMEKDPTYLSSLKALRKVEKSRLLDGNWNIRPSAGDYFQRGWFEVVDVLPGEYRSIIRFWDRAATKPSEENKNPDWTRGLKLYKYSNGTFVVGHLASLQDSPLQVENLIKNTARQDGVEVKIVSQQDPGSAGVAEAENFVRMLQGFDVHTRIMSKDKVTRAKPVSAQCEARNIKVLRGAWNEAFFSELENFPVGAHDDIVDCLSGAFNELAGELSIFDVL